MSDSVQPHRRQPARLPRPWDSPGKNTGLPFPSPMHESEKWKWCLTLSYPMDCSPPGSNIHGIFQARVLEWVAIAFSVPNLEPVPIWPVLTVAFWPAHRFLRRQIRWSYIPISIRIFHSLLWSTLRLWCSQWSRSRCFSRNPLLL